MRDRPLTNRALPRLRTGYGTAVLLALLAAGSAALAQERDAVHLLAAGSLRAALTDVAAAYTRRYGVPVSLTFGPSGLLRERIEAGERADVFASANMEHPLSLEAAGRGGPVVMFARNRLRALARPDLDCRRPARLVPPHDIPSCRPSVSERWHPPGHAAMAVMGVPTM